MDFFLWFPLLPDSRSGAQKSVSGRLFSVKLRRVILEVDYLVNLAGESLGKEKKGWCSNRF